MALKNGVRMRDALGGGFGYVVWWLRLSWYSRTHLPPPLSISRTPSVEQQRQQQQH